jgi:hypothetical protein
MMAEGKLPPHATQTPTPTPAPIPRPLPPTLAEQAFERNRAAFALSAKYPVRPVAVLTPEQLAATRAQAGVSVPRGKPQTVDRRPLTAPEIEAARERLAEQSSWAAVDAWMSPAGTVH